MLRRRTDTPAARQSQPINRFVPYRPDEVGSSGNDLLLLVERPDFRGATYQVANRYTLAARQANQRVASHALAKIRYHRLFILPLLDAAVELGQRDHRQTQLLRQGFQASRDFSNLGRAILFVTWHLHQLQIIDDDEVESMLALQTSCTRAQLRRIQCRSLVDENTGFRQLPCGARDARPVVVSNLPAANAGERHTPDRGQHARHDLLGRHFHREDRHRGFDVALQRGIFSHVDGEGRLSHRGATGYHDEIARPQAAGFTIQFIEAGRQAPQFVGIRMPVIDLIDQRRHQGFDGHRAFEPPARTGFRNFENALLSAIDQLTRRLAFVDKHRTRGLGARVQQASQ